ncbi:hypothetical protein [Saccharothrix variisporea]|uniref:Deazaflavin-dependent oxidoreductase (Nitroreductase family) n=1 Tax=Saccharothrix variisporea TaxID=543527 RepID=A0A495XK22_9PSEU|nr:hypothetical protein [Saccharothrix variisporea]RKT74891.1 hypothetical protein DFJ66_8266 [Saccharothrix variisporea]
MESKVGSSHPVARRTAPLVGQVLSRLLGSPARRVVSGKLCVLRYRAAGGAVVELPVQYARDGDRLVVVAGGAAGKRWWRHFCREAPVEVLLDGEWVDGSAVVAVGGARDAALVGYGRVFRRVPADAETVVIRLRERDVRTPLRGWALVRAWVLVVTVAEFVGFAVPATVGVLTRDSAAVPALLAAGAVEGAVLGWGQASVLRRALPGLSRARWVAATAGAAVLAYLVGLAPSTGGSVITTWHPVLLAVVAAVLGGVLLASIGTAQWLVLRRHVRRAGRWVGVTAVAWLLGLGVFLGFTMPLWQPGQAVATSVVIGVVGGLLMAATTAVVTGYVLRTLVVDSS